MTYTNINSLFKFLQDPINSNRLFAHIEDEKITYGILMEEIGKIHSVFKNNGVKKGDKIILSTVVDYYTALFYLAFLRYGVATIFIDPNMPPKRAKAIIQKSETSIFVMDELLFIDRDIDTSKASFYLKINLEVQKKGKLFNRLLKNKIEQPSADPFIFPAILNKTAILKDPIENVEDIDLAYILFTSGTISDPKGVMITHGNLFTHLNTLSKVYCLNKNDRLLNILMLYHTDGINQGPLLTAYNQAAWIRPFRFDLSSIGALFNSIYKYRVSHFITVPTMLSFMNKFQEGYEDSFQTTDFKFIISVASSLELKLWQDFEEKFHTQIVNVYGLTETVTGSLFCGVNGSKRKLGTVGVPIDCEAKIIKPDGEIAAANEAGVLWLKGNHIFKGYFNNTVATNLVFQEGWLNTGDIATRDEDGFYKITGREKNTINSGGINIYPEQITEMINTHPNVVESVCLGMEEEDFEEKLVCAIVLKPNETLNKNDLLIYLRNLLEPGQIPKNFYFFDELPKGLSGKIQLNAVKELILSIAIKVESKGTASISNAIINIASEAFNLDNTLIKMKDSSHSIDGWDSMAHLVFITTLEKKFSLKFSTAEMMNMNILTAVEKIITEKLKVNEV